MSKFKFINIIDTLFLLVITLLIFFTWIQFFVKNIILSLFLSLVLTIGILIILKWIRYKKQLKVKSKYDTNLNLMRFKLTIQTMPTLKLATIIKRLLPKEYTPKINKGEITFVKNNLSNLFTFYYSSELNELKLLEIIKNTKVNNITIFCSNYNQNIEVIAKAFKNRTITLISLEQLYEIFNNKNITIDTSNIDLNKHKITLKEIFKNSISRDKSKGYFISGLVLLLTSLIIPYKIYYVVFSSILFILSLICRLHISNKVSKSIFD